MPATIENPAPEITVELTVTGEVPVEVSVRYCTEAVSTVTSPKDKLPELTDNRGFGIAIPVPLNATAIFPEVELLLIVNCPVAAPAAPGMNCTCNVIDWPGLSITGNSAPTILNPLPVTLAAFTVTAAVPVEVNVTS
jgi:hypothetical protein